MASAIGSLSVGEKYFNQLIKRTIANASGSASIIRRFAFAYCTSLITASFPVTTSIGMYAF